jgi:hypothetical protein
LKGAIAGSVKYRGTYIRALDIKRENDYDEKESLTARPFRVTHEMHLR